MSNISELKRHLQSVGLPTSTPGLSGDDRFEELKHRWQLHLRNQQQNRDITAAASVAASRDSDHCDGSGMVSSFEVPSLNHLSIGEIRSRLSSLGENTSTPGNQHASAGYFAVIFKSTGMGVQT